MNSVEFLKKMMVSYQNLVNLTMGNNEDPILKTDVITEERECTLMTGHKELTYRVAAVELVVDGVVIAGMKKVLEEGEELKDVRDEIGDQMMVGLFSTAINLFRTRKVNADLSELLKKPVAEEDAFRKN